MLFVMVTVQYPRSTDVVSILSIVDETMMEMEVAAKISRASLYVAVMSLDSDTKTVPKSGSSISPFDGRNGVELIFDESTFGNHDAKLELKVFHKYGSLDTIYKQSSLLFWGS